MDDLPHGGESGEVGPSLADEVEEGRRRLVGMRVARDRDHGEGHGRLDAADVVGTGDLPDRRLDVLGLRTTGQHRHRDAHREPKDASGLGRAAQGSRRPWSLRLARPQRAAAQDACGSRAGGVPAAGATVLRRRSSLRTSADDDDRARATSDAHRPLVDRQLDRVEDPLERAERRGQEDRRAATAPRPSAASGSRAARC